MATRMEQRRGTAAEWVSLNPILADGEIGVERDTGNFKVGDGVTAWNDISTAYIRRDVVNAAGDLIVGSGHNTYAALPKGTSGQRLTVLPDGTLAWADLPPEDNPFTGIDAAGDLLVGTGADAVGRLPVGSNGQRLTVLPDGSVGWATLPATPNPFTVINAVGDLIVGNGDDAVIRLPRGATGQRLTVLADGTLAWADMPDLSPFETLAHAASTYETASHASSTYETQAHAGTTYDTISRADSTYFKQIYRVYKEKTADLSRTTSGLAADPDLNFLVDANSTWLIDALLFATGDTGEIKVGFNGPAGSDIAFAGAGPHNSAAGSNASGEWVGRPPAAPTTTTIPFATVAGVTMGIEIKARLKVGATAGLCQLQWGQLTTAAGSPTSVLAGSLLFARRVLGT